MRKHFDNYLPSDYVFISPTYSKSNTIELLIPHPKHGLINITESGEVKYIRNSVSVNYNKTMGNDLPASEDIGKIMNLAISPDSKSVAIYNELGVVFVIPANMDIDGKLVTHSDIVLKQPYQFIWCSIDCVILVYNGTISMIGPDNNKLTLNIVQGSQPNLFCVSEIDGVRIFYDENVDFLQKVHDDLYLSIFPLSFDPSKKLLEAYKVLIIKSVCGR
jgi:hypothetical protein